MQTAVMLQYNSRAYLTHTFGRDPDDPRYLVERFQSYFDGRSCQPQEHVRPAHGGIGRARSGSNPGAERASARVM